jgi:hypothetical protein
MRRLLLSILLAVPWFGSVKAQKLTAERTATVEEREILEIEHDRIRATAEGGSVAADWYDNHWVDDIAITLQDGATPTKAQWAAQFRSEGFKVLFQDHYDYQVRLYNGDTAVVTYLGWARSGMGLKPTALLGKNTKYLNTYHHSAITDVLIKQDGKWRVVVHHVTTIPTGGGG